MKRERPAKSFAQRPNGDPRVQYAAIALSLMIFLALFFYARQGRSVYVARQNF